MSDSLFPLIPSRPARPVPIKPGSPTSPPSSLRSSASPAGCSATVASSGSGNTGCRPRRSSAFMGFFMALTLTLQAAARRTLRNLRPRSVVRQVLRALLDMTNNVCRRHCPAPSLADHVLHPGLHLAHGHLPAFAALLGERITLKKAMALVVGFSGVVIAVNPFGHDSASTSSASPVAWCASALLFGQHGLVARAHAHRAAREPCLLLRRGDGHRRPGAHQSASPAAHATLWLALGLMGVSAQPARSASISPSSTLGQQRFRSTTTPSCSPAR